MGSIEDLNAEDNTHLAYIHAWIDSKVRKGFDDVEIQYPLNLDIEGGQELYNVLKMIEEGLVQEYSRNNSHPDLPKKESDLKEIINSLIDRSFNKDLGGFLDKLYVLYLDLNTLNLSSTTRTWVLKVNNIIHSVKAIEKHKQLKEKTENEFIKKLSNPEFNQAIDNLKIKSAIPKADRLDPQQHAVLFYYLRKHKVIKDYSNLDSGKLLNLSTGYSAQNFRADLSTNLKDIMRFKSGKPSSENLDMVEELLLDIVSDIRKDKSQNKPKG